jgi:hypothetical protein
MVHYSVLVPLRDANATAMRLVAQLSEALDGLILPYEIICILDARPAPSTDELDRWMRRHKHLRVLTFDRPCGPSAALCAGIAASRGTLVLGVSPEAHLPADRVSHLISWLGRYDFAFAEAERKLGRSLMAAWAGIRRRLAGGDRRTTGGLFFAARRESLVGMALAQGALAVLPALVEQRGFRVCRVTIGDRRPPRAARFRPGLLKRWAASRHARRFAPYLAREHARPDEVEPSPARARVVVQPLRPSPHPPAAHKHH